LSNIKSTGIEKENIYTTNYADLARDVYTAEYLQFKMARNISGQIERENIMQSSNPVNPNYK
jgi:hypothetical protein